MHAHYLLIAFFLCLKVLGFEMDKGLPILEKLPIPTLESLHWPIVDVLGSRLFKSKLLFDIHCMLKFSKASKSINTSWNMPMHVFKE